MKNFKKYISLSFILFYTMLTFGQSLGVNNICTTDEYRSSLKHRYPNLESIDEFERWISPLIEQYNTGNRTSENCNGPINVIFHIIHNGDAPGTGDNIAASLIYAQIDQLNEDFAATGISFVAAQKKPNGQTLADPGIDRIDSYWGPPPYGNNGCDRPDQDDPGDLASSNIETQIKPNTVWDTDRYLNIWVLDLFCNTRGYAQPPHSSNLPGPEADYLGTADTDGIVIEPTTVGSLLSPNPYGDERAYGRTLTHETGHFFSLYHLWGPCESNCCDIDDFCDDTPNASSSNIPNIECIVTSDICPGSNPTTDNFMDYSHDQCRNEFTADQIARMVVVLNNSPRRGSLCCESTLSIDFQMEDQNGQEEDVFCYGESIFFSGNTNNFVPQYYLEVKRKQLASNDAWVYLVGLESVNTSSFDFGNWLSEFGHNLIPGEYSIKFAAQNECDSWTEIIHQFEIHSNQVVSQFHFEDEDQNIREEFCSFEQVFLNGNASNGEVRYWLEVGKAPLGSQDFNPEASGEVDGQISTLNFNLWMSMEDTPLEEGFIYQVKLGVQNACAPEDELTRQFIFNDCCAPPTNLTCTTDINGNKFLTWVNNEPNANGFLLYIDPTSSCCENQDETSPNGIFVPTNQYSFKNIRHSCFGWQVKAICDDGSFSPLSEIACHTSSTICIGFSPFQEDNHTENKLPLKSTISPNPNTGRVMIELEITEPMGIHIEIYTTTGELVSNFEKEETNAGIYQKEWIADDFLINGIYLVLIHTDKEVIQKKMVLMR